MNILFNDLGVQALLDDFQSLVDVKISVFNIEGQEVYGSIRADHTFCKDARMHEIINQRCCKCDEDAFAYVHKSRDIYVYQCHLGLYEALAPLLDGETIIGYIMVGQILNQSKVEDQWNQILLKSKMAGVDLADLKESFFQLRQLTEKEIKAIANIMHACSAYIWIKHLLSIERAPLSVKIQHFIIDHMEEKITTSLLCQHFAVGKTALYQCLKDNYGLSLMQFARKIKMEQAKKYLENSELTISEIASLVGYLDYNYFSRDFKKVEGKTPREWRKRY